MLSNEVIADIATSGLQSIESMNFSVDASEMRYIYREAGPAGLREKNISKENKHYFVIVHPSQSNSYPV